MSQEGRKLLIVSEYIAPMQEIASIRMTKIAKYLMLTGRYQASVLTNEKDFEGNRKNRTRFFRDPLLEKDTGYFQQVYIVPETTAQRWFDVIKRKVLGPQSKQKNTIASPGESSGIKVTLREFSLICKDFLQERAAKRFLRKHPELTAYDVVISSFGPTWPHLIARKLKERNPSIVWLADYRDPCCREGTPAIFRGKYSRFPSAKTGTANRVIVASGAMLPLLRLSPTQRTGAVLSGYELSEENPPENPRVFSLLYTGTLYNVGIQRQDLTPAFAAIQELIAEGVMERGEVLLQYAGNMGDLFAAQAAACGLGDRVQDMGLLPRDAVEKLRREAAILVIAIWNTQAEYGIIPGKIFEYMLSHKPILGLTSGDLPESSVTELVRGGKLGFCYEEPSDARDGPALKAWLKELYAAWKKSGTLPFAPDEEYVRQFGYDRIAGQVDRIIDEEIDNYGDNMFRA